MYTVHSPRSLTQIPSLRARLFHITLVPLYAMRVTIIKREGLLGIWEQPVGGDFFRRLQSVGYVIPYPGQIQLAIFPGFLISPFVTKVK